jgi:hypothetical protein
MDISRTSPLSYFRAIFNNTQTLTEAILPSLTSGMMDMIFMFNNCPNLKKVVLPYNLQRISMSFINCPKLKTLIFPPKVATYDSSFTNTTYPTNQFDVLIFLGIVPSADQFNFQNVTIGTVYCLAGNIPLLQNNTGFGANHNSIVYKDITTFTQTEVESDDGFFIDSNNNIVNNRNILFDPSLDITWNQSPMTEYSLVNKQYVDDNIDNSINNFYDIDNDVQVISSTPTAVF